MSKELKMSKVPFSFKYMYIKENFKAIFFMIAKYNWKASHIILDWVYRQFTTAKKNAIGVQ